MQICIFDEDIDGWRKWVYAVSSCQPKQIHHTFKPYQYGKSWKKHLPPPPPLAGFNGQIIGQKIRFMYIFMYIYANQSCLLLIFDISYINSINRLIDLVI